MMIITMGDPNGIGPELICRIFGEQLIEIEEEILIIGHEEPLLYYLKLFSIKKFWKEYNTEEGRGGIMLYPVDVENFHFTPGRPSTEGGYISGRSLEIACDLLKKKIANTLITCPLNKKTLMDAGFNFPGHTEFLAESFGLNADDVCMHLFGERLRVSLVTTHPPLKKVPGLITISKVYRCLSLTWEMLKKLELHSKPIGVCGLNPHAGEEGKIGTEEIEIIGPAIEMAIEDGIDAKGPYPADSLFHRAYCGEFSAILAMYHDQGLGPLKLVHFNESVNITLGLPVVRTSVDHGTAYDLVGKKIANTKSLIKAIELGRKLL